MRHRRALFALCLLTARFAPAQDAAPVLTVMDFSASGVARSEVTVFTDYLASHIVQTRRFTVIDRVQREMLLQEIEFSLSDCTDESCQLEIGRMLSASQIVVGSLGRFGERFVCNLKLIEVETSQTLNAVSKAYSSLNELLEDSRSLISSLLQVELPAPEQTPSAEAPGPPAPPGPSREIRWPSRTIRIDGRYTDWDEVDPLLLDLAGDQAGEVRGTDIAAVYLAADSKYYYVRFQVADGDFPSFHPDFFSAHVSIRLSADEFLNLSVVQQNGWKAQVETRERITRRTTVLATGSMRRSGAGFEARFPRAAVERLLTQGLPYPLTGVIGYGRAQRWFPADYTPTILLFF